MRKPISKYRDFDDEAEEKPYEFTGPLKVDNVALGKRMEMLHTLMVTWNIKPWDFSAYLQRDLFPGAKREAAPDEKTYDNAIGKLRKLRQQSTEKEGQQIEEANEPATSDNPQNNFGGISPGGISLFEEDFIPSTGGMDSVEGYNFTMCSTLSGLWTLEGLNCHIVGLRSPFGRTEYVEYLNSLDERAVALLAERMEFYEMPEDEASLMFGINNTIRVLQARMDNPENLLYYVVYPDGDYEMTTDFNNTFLGEEISNRIKNYIGRKVYGWLKTKFKQFTQ